MLNETAMDHQLVVVMWADKDLHKFIGYTKEIENEGFLIDHFKRELSSSSKLWKYPSKSDVHFVGNEPILNIKVEVS